MTEKEIGLAMSFDDAPKEVQKCAQDLKDAYIRCKKADHQFALWNEEREVSKRDLQKCLNQFNSALDKYDPAGIKDSKREDLK